MTDVAFAEFSNELEALCHKYGVTLSAESKSVVVRLSSIPGVTALENGDIPLSPREQKTRAYLYGP